VITAAQRILISVGFAGEIAWKLFWILFLGRLDFWSTARSARLLLNCPKILYRSRRRSSGSAGKRRDQ
jgi:hypothetical protein